METNWNQVELYMAVQVWWQIKLAYAYHAAFVLMMSMCHANWTADLNQSMLGITLKYMGINNTPLCMILGWDPNYTSDLNLFLHNSEHSINWHISIQQVYINTVWYTCALSYLHIVPIYKYRWIHNLYVTHS